MSENVNMRETILDKIIEKADNGDFVCSPVGVWAVFAMAGYTFEEALENLSMTQEEAFEKLEQYSESSQKTDELLLKNFIWAEKEDFIKNTPDSDYIEKGKIPSQKEADEIVKEFTKGLIDKFPGDLSQAILVFTNIITMVFEWKKEFDVIKTPDSMMLQWLVDEVLYEEGKQDDNGEVMFTYDDDNNLYALFAKYSGNGSYVISAVSTNDEISRDKTINVLYDVIEKKRKLLVAKQLFEQGITVGNNFEIKEFRQGVKDTYSVTIPAWEIESTLDLTNVFTMPGDTTMLQKAIAKYQVKGFKAAAVTAMLTRSAFIPPEKTYHVELQFDKPFASLAMYSSKEWKQTPAFVAWTEKAVEPDNTWDE